MTVRVLYSNTPNLFVTKGQFHGRQFFPAQVGDGFKMIRAHCTYCAPYFYYNYHISSPSDLQTLAPGYWGPLL